MAAEGLDLSDPAAINAWMNEFNARSYDERAMILSDDVLGASLPLPAVELPDEAEARRSAAQSPLLVQARLLVDFVGEGLKLTQTGNVNLADARQLVTLLDTGDRFDETIGERTFKTGNVNDLPHLAFVIRIATKARFVRAVKGKLLSTKAGQALGRNPLADLDRLISAIDDLGMVTARTAGGHYARRGITPFFDDLFVPITMLLLSDPHEVTFDDLVERAFEDFEADIKLDGPHYQLKSRRQDLVESELRRAVTTLEDAGIATWANELDTSPHGTTSRVRGTVTLTPAGRWATHRYLADAHDIHLPIFQPAQFSNHSFDALITACEAAAPDDFGFLMREIMAWTNHRGNQALDDLTLAARTAPDAAIRNIALAVLAEQFFPEAEPAVRSLLDDPSTRGSALLWLVDLEFEPPESLLDPDPEVFGDILALTLVSSGPADMTDVFQHVGNHETQLATLQQLWRLPSSAVGLVLVALGRHHPSAKIAKAARKASMQHASRQANQRR
jgi:hypothetical protein